MYETRQHKEATSRVIQKPEGKRGQMFRAEDNIWFRDYMGVKCSRSVSSASSNNIPKSLSPLQIKPNNQTPPYQLRYHGEPRLP